MNSNGPFFLFTVDVEDWFQVENFKPWIPFSSWDSRELRVERNVHRLMDLFDEPRRDDAGSVRATFFILGWVARKLPRLVHAINARGHEVASHGDNHGLPTRMAPESFRQDLVDSRRRLEDLTGAAVSGYRAPSFNIDDGILRIIGAAGFGYDSSYNSFELHGRYGRISLSAAKRNGGGFRIADNFHELPISNLRLFGRVLPWGGGGYFRLIPWPLFAGGVRRIIASNGVYVFYLHPWEIDPGQPRVERAGMQLKFRHYTNLKKTHARVAKLLNAFGHCRFTSCRDYLAATAETEAPSAIHPQTCRPAAGLVPN